MFWGYNRKYHQFVSFIVCGIICINQGLEFCRYPIRFVTIFVVRFGGYKALKLFCLSQCNQATKLFLKCCFRFFVLSFVVPQRCIRHIINWTLYLEFDGTHSLCTIVQKLIHILMDGSVRAGGGTKSGSSMFSVFTSKSSTGFFRFGIHNIPPIGN